MYFNWQLFIVLTWDDRVYKPTDVIDMQWIAEEVLCCSGLCDGGGAVECQSCISQLPDWSTGLRCFVTTLGAGSSQFCASVLKQYHLVPVNGTDALGLRMSPHAWWKVPLTLWQLASSFYDASLFLLFYYASAPLDGFNSQSSRYQATRSTQPSIPPV